MQIKLSNRLQAIADSIEKGASVVDVGTDHGYLPVYLAQNEIAVSIVASDVSVGSLEAAVRSFRKYALSERIKTVHASGLDGVLDSEVDTVVISGMGGETIISILEDAFWTRHGKTLILQPQSKTEQLVCFLSGNGYAIFDAKLALDNAKYYVILVVGEAGATVSSVASFYDVLKLLAAKNDPYFGAYLNKEILSAKRTAEGMRMSSHSGYEETKAYVHDLIKLSRDFT